MRDFHDAKAMAHSLRAALAAKDIKVSNSQSLELIAEAFGAADWNTLAAAIRAETSAPRMKTIPLPSPAVSTAAPGISTQLEATLQRALACAKQRQQEYSTLEHLLLALADDADASAIMKACKVDVDVLKQSLADYIDNALKHLVIEELRNPLPTAAFQRVVRGAGLTAQKLGHPDVTGAQVLAGIFSETRSPAARFLGETQDAVNLLVQNLGIGNGDTAR
jgi:hypothetical protein